VRILIDTNAYSALMRGNEIIAQHLEKAAIVYLSVVVAGELIAGFKNGRKELINRNIFNDFIEKAGKTIVLPITLETAERFASIKAALRKKGRPIPINDIWLAAQCLETGARLLTLDSHFKEVDGLLLV
jgi:tRNA(fMet)-specific endonuclease VapC